VNDDEVITWLSDQERKHFEEWKRVLRLGFGDTGAELDLARSLAATRKALAAREFSERVGPDGDRECICGAWEGVADGKHKPDCIFAAMPRPGSPRGTHAR
jgi:hypothetical protein